MLPVTVWTWLWDIPVSSHTNTAKENIKNDWKCADLQESHRICCQVVGHQISTCLIWEVLDSLDCIIQQNHQTRGVEEWRSSSSPVQKRVESKLQCFTFLCYLKQMYIKMHINSKKRRAPERLRCCFFSSSLHQECAAEEGCTSINSCFASISVTGLSFSPSGATSSPYVGQNAGSSWGRVQRRLTAEHVSFTVSTAQHRSSPAKL